MSGFFIALEGPDGVGKTTQARMLAEALRAHRYKVHLTAEPTSGPIGQFLRQALKGEIRIEDPRALQLMFAADRLEHLRAEVRPALERGEIVICDRYALSTIVYAVASNPDADRMAVADWLSDVGRHNIRPDLLLLLDADDAALDQRLYVRSELDEFERRDFRKRVREAYRSVPAELIDRTSSRGLLDGIHGFGVSDDAQFVAMRIYKYVWRELQHRIETGETSLAVSA